MNKLATNTTSKNGLLLSVGLLIGATAFSVDAQDRSYARQNGESRSQSSDRSRAATSTVELAKRDNSHSNSRGDSRGNSHSNSRGDSRGNSHSSSRGNSRGDRYAAQASNQFYNDAQRGRSNSQNYGNHGGRNDNNRYNSGRRDNNYGRHTPAYGATDYRRGDHRQNDYRPRNNQHNQHNQHNNWRSPSWRSQWHHGWSGRGHHASSRYYYPSGYSSFRWSIGYVLPRAFYRSNYYVNYDAYGLAPPPYGARWLRVDSDLLLVDIASYEIIEVLRGFYYY